MYVQINAGRNQGSTPMSLSTWIRFQAELISVVSDTFLTDAIEIHYGQGTWEGVSEESVHVSHVSTEDFHNVVSAETYRQLDDRIFELKRIYCQDEIAVIVS